MEYCYFELAGRQGRGTEKWLQNLEAPKHWQHWSHWWPFTELKKKTEHFGRWVQLWRGVPMQSNRLGVSQCIKTIKNHGSLSTLSVLSPSHHAINHFADFGSVGRLLHWWWSASSWRTRLGNYAWHAWHQTLSRIESIKSIKWCGEIFLKKCKTNECRRSNSNAKHQSWTTRTESAVAFRNSSLQ